MKNYNIKSKTAKREFDLLEPSSNSRIKIRRAKEDELVKACQFGNAEIPGGVSSVDVVKSVMEFNSDNIFSFLRHGDLVGFYAMLMLSPIGLERLLLNEFNGSHPDPICLVPTDETPAAIYKWAVFAPGLATEGIKHISKFLRQLKYKNVNFISWPNTEAGVRINKNLGFKPIHCAKRGLYRYERIPNRAQICFDIGREGVI